MIEVTGNIWRYPADFIVITTNGDINSKSEAVMGRGVALQAATRYPWIKLALARYIRSSGNCLHYILSGDSRIIPPIIAFPVKHHWREKADLELIAQSAKELQIFINMNNVNKELIYVMPKPGCGNGGLSWKEVKPVIEFLPDNVHVIDLN